MEKGKVEKGMKKGKEREESSGEEEDGGSFIERMKGKQGERMGSKMNHLRLIPS